MEFTRQMPSFNKSMSIRNNCDFVKLMLTIKQGCQNMHEKEFKLPPGTVHAGWFSRDRVFKAVDSDLSRQRLVRV